MMDWNMVLSIIALVISIIAIVQTAIQISISNKQQLFDRRLKAYMKSSGLAELYKTNKTLLEGKRADHPFYANDLYFTWLTNNIDLEELAHSIKHPLEQPYHVNCLKKCEELVSLAEEVELIFSNNAAVIVANYIKSYANVLMSMYQYQIILDNMRKENDKCAQTEEYLVSLFGEKEYREKLYASMNELKIANDKLCQKDALNKMRKSLKLS